MRPLIAAASLRLFLLLGALAVSHASTDIASEPAPAHDTTAASEADMTYFYKNPSPERVATLIVYFNSLHQTAKANPQPPIMGFLAAAFQRYPNDLDKMIPDGLSATMQWNVAGALRLAGQSAKAQAVADHLAATGAAAPNLADVPPSLDAISVSGPSDFDFLWGASFASADPRYCWRILNHFATVANVDGNAEDMVTLVRDRENGTDEHWIVQKRGAAEAQDLIAQSTALWALYSNSLQHEFVRTAVAQYIGKHPQDPASKALLTLARQYGYYNLAQVISTAQTAPGKHSVTVNITLLTQILDDLGRSAGSYPVHFQFPDDRARAEADVSALSSVLDPLSSSFAHDAPLQLRLGLLHAIGFNLDIPDSYGKAIAAFSTLMQIAPEDPQSNYQYGAFLAATTKKGEGIPFLEKAKSLGVLNADYWLGLSYIKIRDKSKAIENLESYTRRVPGDQVAGHMLDAVRHDSVNIMERTTSP